MITTTGCGPWYFQGCQMLLKQKLLQIWRPCRAEPSRKVKGINQEWSSSGWALISCGWTEMNHDWSLAFCCRFCRESLGIIGLRPSVGYHSEQWNPHIQAAWSMGLPETVFPIDNCYALGWLVGTTVSGQTLIRIGRAWSLDRFLFSRAESPLSPPLPALSDYDRPWFVPLLRWRLVMWSPWQAMLMLPCLWPRATWMVNKRSSCR